MAKEGNKEGTQEVDAPKSSAQEVEVPVVEVRDQAIKSAGTGTLHLEQASPSASRLGLSIREIPATVEIVDQTLLQERGLRTISEAVEGTTGVTVGDSPGNPANFSMRGFTNNQLRLLYDGLMIGPASMTSRPRDTWNLERIEILKGPASVLYGEGALGGAINFVTKRIPVKPSFTLKAKDSRFIQANMSTSPVPCSCAITGTRPCASHCT